MTKTPRPKRAHLERDLIVAQQQRDRALERAEAAELRGQLVEVRRELMPNGGSSFSDLVNKRLDAQDARLKGLEDGQQQIVDRMDGGA